MDESEIRALFPVGTSLPEIEYDDETKEWYLYWYISPKRTLFIVINANGIVTWSEIQDGIPRHGQCEIKDIPEIVKSFYRKETNMENKIVIVTCWAKTGVIGQFRKEGAANITPDMVKIVGWLICQTDEKVIVACEKSLRGAYQSLTVIPAGSVISVVELVQAAQKGDEHGSGR